jgi:hypothetical protein
MDGGQRSADSFIGKSEQPPRNAVGAFGQVDSQSLNQNQGGEVLFHEAAAGSRGPKLAHQKIQGPVKSGIDRLFADVNDGRKEIEEDIGMGAREEKVSAEGQAISASVESDDVAVMPDRRLKDRRVGGRQRRVGRQTTRLSSRKQHAVSCFEAQRFRPSPYQQPKPTRDQGVVLDAFKPWKLYRVVSTHIKTAAGKAVRLEERNDIGKGIHEPSWTIPTIIWTQEYRSYEVNVLLFN